MSGMGRRERRELARAREEAQERASTLEGMKRFLQDGDAFIAREKRLIEEKTDVQLGLYYRPPPKYFFAVSIREKVLEVISDLESGAQMKQVNQKLAAIDRERKSWERRAKSSGLDWPS